MMPGGLTAQIAKHLRDVHFGGNWTTSSLKEHLSGVTWDQAITQVDSYNTIAKLVYHINYYISAVLKVLEGEALTASDKFSFDHPLIQSKDDWDNMVTKLFSDAEKFASLIEKLPDSKLSEIFIDEKYGSYYRNLAGIIEHTHYHLGQLVIIKKLIQPSVAH